MSDLIRFYIKNKWTYLTALPLFVSTLPSYFTPKHQLVLPPDGHRYTLFDLSGSTMILLMVCLPLAIMIYAVILDWNGRSKTLEIGLLSGLALFSWSLLLHQSRDSLNYHLDSTRVSVTDAKVLKTSIHRGSPRRGLGTIYFIYSTVKWTDTESLTFETHYNVNKDNFQAPQTATFTLGRGFFNRTYVLNVETQ